MKNLALCLTLIFSGLFLSAPLPAHHGEVNYDTEKVVSVKGTVTDFQFINPHVQIFLDVKNDKGEIVDTWGTPIQFYFSHDSVMIRSAGPNKVWEDSSHPGSDDIYRTDTK